MYRPFFTLTVLGASRAMPNVGGHCSGYLLRTPESSVLMDCGPGVVGQLLKVQDPTELSAVVISHWHADHYFDLAPLYYTLKYGLSPLPDGRRIELWVPPGGRTHMAQFSRLVGGSDSMFDALFDIREYGTAGSHRLGSFDFQFVRVQHYIPSHAMRVSTEGGPTLAYSADVGPCAPLLDVARGANLFLCEAAFSDSSQDEAEPARRGHLAPAEAADFAQRAGARRLLLTHCLRGVEWDEPFLTAARSVFSGSVDLADEGRTYVVE